MLTKYITPTDYLNYFGEDLNLTLPDDDMSDSHKAERFLKTVEDDVELYLADNCFKIVDNEYSHMTDYQKRMYKMALLNQTRYKAKNGDIGNDSAYDPSTGVVADRKVLQEITLSDKCKKYLRLAGLYDRNIITGGGSIFNRFF